MPGIGDVVGDVAYGGNWFFLAEHHGPALSASSTDELTNYAGRVREALNAQGHPEVDHLELFGAPSDTSANSRSFVLCPGNAYDRSPCGTGFSAKLACLAADRALAPGQVMRMESVIGSVFEGSYVDLSDGRIRPRITGRAHVMAEGRLLIEDDDPFAFGIDAR